MGRTKAKKASSGRRHARESSVEDPLGDSLVDPLHDDAFVAEGMKTDIARVETIFEEELGDHEESFLGRRRRHRRNKDLKKQARAERGLGGSSDAGGPGYRIEKKNLAAKKRRKKKKDRKEHRKRVKRNARLKAQIEASGKAMFADDKQARDEWIERQYALDKEYAGGERERKLILTKLNRQKRARDSAEAAEIETIGQAKKAESIGDKRRRIKRNAKLKADIERSGKVIFSDDKKARQEWVEREYALRKEYAGGPKERRRVLAKMNADKVYKEQKEHSPDGARRRHNKQLKAELKERAARLYPDDKERQKEFFEKNYLRQRKHVKGEKGTKKAEKYLLKKELKGRAKNFFGKDDEIEVMRKLWVKEQLIRRTGFDDPAEREAALAKIEKKKIAFNKEDTKSRDPKGHAKRVKRNKKLLARLEGDAKVWFPDDEAAQKRWVAQNYARKKEYSGGPAERRRAIQKVDAKHRAKQKKKGVKERNKQLKAQFAEHYDDPKEARRQYALFMETADADDVKKKNAKLRKLFSRKEYRAFKQYGGVDREEVETDSNVQDVIQGVGYLSKGAKQGNKAVGKIAKQVATPTTTSDGGKDSGTVLGTSYENDSGQKFTTGGTTRQAGGLILGVQGIEKLVSSSADLDGAIKMREDLDPANREKAKADIAKSVSGITDGTVTVGNSVVRSMQAFTTSTELAEDLQLTGIPIVGIVSKSKQLVEAAVDLGQAAVRAAKAVTMRKRAKDNRDLSMAASLKSLRHADLRLVTSSSFDVLISGMGIVGDGLTVAAAPVGATIKSVSMALGAVKSLGTTIQESAHGSQRKKAVGKYHDTLDNDASDSSDVIRRAKKLLETDEKYAVQIMIERARDGDEGALDYLGLFHLDAKDFSTMSNEAARKHILKAIKTAEEPETLLDQLKGVPNKLRGLKRTWRDKVQKKGY